MKTIANIKNELTTTEFTSFEILVRLGDSIQLAYETVIKERKSEINKKSAYNIYRYAYTN
jgi:hypothetical protein